MYVKTVRNTSQILRIDCVNGAGTRKGLILHRFALSVGKDVLLHGMVCVTTVVQRCLRSPINLACLGRKLFEWVELEYVILQARYDGLSFQENCRADKNCQLRNVPISPSKRLIDADLGIT